MGEDVPPGIGLRTRLDGDQLEVELLFDVESWEPRLAKEPAEILIARGSSGVPETLVWERLEPGRFRARRTLESGSFYRGAVAVGATRLPFGPLAAPMGVEWSYDEDRVRELSALSQASGGVERTDLSDAWEAPAFGGELELRAHLLAAFLLVFLADGLVARTGWRLPSFDLGQRAPRPAAVAVRSTAPEPAHPEPELEPIHAGAARRRRFDHAKRGR